MGMDVSGKKPTADAGTYFRNNVWWWRPLWNYVIEVAPELTTKVEHGQYNSGDGLGARDSRTLAAMLTAELDAGRTAQYEADYTARVAALPDEQCWLCSGSGTRTDQLAVERGWDTPHGCNVCKGTGMRRPAETDYPFSAENVAEFRDFVAASGGFEIW
jgi:hypothetical protein